MSNHSFSLSLQLLGFNILILNVHVIWFIFPAVSFGKYCEETKTLEYFYFHHPRLFSVLDFLLLSLMLWLL